jgi:hypothetical protein
MAEEFKPENPRSSTPSGKAGFDSKEFKELIKVASHVLAVRCLML